jgi:hypothetical protein
MRKKDNYGTPVNNHATEAMASLDPSLVSYLLDNAANSSNVEEFISKLMIGECPKCRSSSTVDGDAPPVNDITVGICLACGCHWCLECGNVFPKGETSCSCWLEE